MPRGQQTGAQAHATDRLLAVSPVRPVNGYLAHGLLQAVNDYTATYVYELVLED